MNEYSSKEISDIKGRQKIYKLEINQICDFDKFESNVQAKYKMEIERIYAILERLANLESLTKLQFRDVTPKKELVKEYEVKTKNLRIYLIDKDFSGKLIIIGGYKKDQKKDFNKFRSIKEMYLNQGMINEKN